MRRLRHRRGNAASEVMQDVLETLPGWSCSHAVTERLLSRVRTDPEARVWRIGSAKVQATALATHMLRGHLEPWPVFLQPAQSHFFRGSWERS